MKPDPQTLPNRLRHVARHTKMPTSREATIREAADEIERMRDVRRDCFAALAMLGMIISGGGGNVAPGAVKYADALIDELDARPYRRRDS